MKKKTLAEMIAEEGFCMAPVRGNSMLPTLHGGEDTLLIVRPERHITSNMIAVYCRGGEMIAHRVLAVFGEKLIICGDNCSYIETDIKKSDLIGVASGFWRGTDFHGFDEPAETENAKKARRTLPKRLIKGAFKRK